MVSDVDLRSQLLQLGVNAGPITATTRATYQKKLKKLLDANKTTSNKQQTDKQTNSNGVEQLDGRETVDSPSDAELRDQLLRLGHSPGPITSNTRPVYLKKLARLQADAGSADHNGYGRTTTAGGGGSVTRRRRQTPAPAPSEPEPEPEPEEEEPEPMDDMDAPVDWSAYRPQGPTYSPSCSPVEREFGSLPARRESPLADRRPAGHSLACEAGSVPLSSARYAAETSLGPGRGSRNNADSAPRWSAPATSERRYQPERPLTDGIGRSGLYSETISPRPSTRFSSSLFAGGRPTPPPPARTPTYRTDGGRWSAAEPRSSSLRSDWRPAVAAARADPSPVTRVEPPAPRPRAPRQPVAADYDTWSDSEPEETEEAPPLTPTQQLQAFRRRMSAPASRRPLSERATAGLRAAAGHGASHLVPCLILLLALLFFGLLGLSYLRLARTDEPALSGDTMVGSAADTAPTTVAVFPICGEPAADPALGCVHQDRLEPAVLLLQTVQPALVGAARDALCARRDSQAVTLAELAEITTASQDQLRDLAVLVAHNSQLGLRADLSAADNISLSAVGVSTPWLCLAGAALALLFKWAFTLGAVLTGILVLRGVVLWRQCSQQRQQEQLYQMVERIMDVVRQHTLNATGSDKPYVAVDHVRDELLTPAERSSRHQAALWRRAVKFIREKESRVREECVMVAGESHTVWRWLPSTGGVGGGSRDRRRVWLGQAFQTSSGVNTPVHTRTNCLKIRHMFDPTCETGGGGWIPEVRDAILEKCDGIAVMHIAVDERSTEGLVYVKCRTDADALSAFKRIQGCWFDGRLVSVKFIRQERFHERYPEAVDSAEPLRPSNGLRRSLAGLQLLPPTEDD